MQILPPSPQTIAAALSILREGGVVAHATETCYGLACDLTNPDAVWKLFAIKQRPDDQPVSALFPSVEAAKEWVKWSDEAQKLADEFLPGPVTIILPIKTGRKLFPCPNPGLSLGVRVSPYPVARELVEGFDTPISTTSANVHGQPNPYSAEEILRQFSKEKHQPDLIIDSGTLPPNPPSKIIDLTKEGQKIIRP